jgi:hypothetical protein
VLNIYTEMRNIYYDSTFVSFASQTKHHSSGLVMALLLNFHGLKLNVM